MRRKFTYHYFVNGNEVSLTVFTRALQQHCMRCDTNDENPFLNISYLDTKKYKRDFNRIKNGSPHLYYVVGDYTKSETFKIERRQHCCFCGKEIIGYGNNPYPVNNDPKARCCDECNDSVVVPARLKAYMEARKNG